jgi:hypothetical protein
VKVRRPPRAQRQRDERGQVAGIEAVPFGLLVLVAGTLLVTNTWAVVDAHLATDAAAREAVRAYVEGWPDPATSWAEARLRGAEAAAAQGRRGENVRFDRRLDPAYARCARATITARYDLPAVRVPFIGGSGHGFTVSSTHSEVIDPHRDGGPTGGSCA